MIDNHVRVSFCPSFRILQGPDHFTALEYATRRRCTCHEQFRKLTRGSAYPHGTCQWLLKVALVNVPQTDVLHANFTLPIINRSFRFFDHCRGYELPLLHFRRLSVPRKKSRFSRCRAISESAKKGSFNLRLIAFYVLDSKSFL